MKHQIKLLINSCYATQGVLFMLLLLSPFVVLAQAVEVPDLIQKAKQLDQSAHEEDALKIFMEVLKIDSNNYKAVWNTSFLYSKIGNRQKESEAKKADFNLAKKYAEKALQLQPNDNNSNYVMAVAMGRMALISPAKEKVAASRDIKKYIDLAIQANPSDARSYHVLGKWNYEVANLNFAERAAAKYLFGGIPDGTLDNAIKNYLKSIKLDPDFILYYLDLAYALNDANLKDETIRVLNEALALQPKTEDDPDNLNQCKALLHTLQ